MKHPLAFFVCVFGLAACDAGVESRKASLPAVHEAGAARPIPALPPRAAQPPVRPTVAAGPARIIPALPAADLQEAAAVVRVDPLPASRAATVKLFGVAGGDPAMNGLHAHLAVFRSPAEGWRVFRIGDVLDYRILADAPGRADLELTESVLDPADGAIRSRTRRVIVGWAVATDGSAPETITLTPAR